MSNVGSRLRWRMLPAVVALAASAGCASGGDPGTPQGQGDDSAGAVALAYANALFSGDLDGAAHYVEDDSAAAFQLIQVGIDPRTIYAKDLDVGSSTVTNGVAVVILTGTVCHKADPPAADDCLSNHDPASSNPVFHLTLRPTTAGDWKVALGVTPATPSTTAPTGR